MNNRIKILREEANMTQVRLSIELEVSQETISAYESGKHYPSVASLIKLSEIFHVSCDYILGISDVPNYELCAPLKDDEQKILLRWKQLSPHQKDIVSAYIDGLTSE